MMDGEGYLELKDRSKYEGQFQKGEKHGRGVLTWADGGKYEGEFENGVRHG